MFRKFIAVALTAAINIATNPGFACTGISLKAKDGAAIRGRTLEFGFPAAIKCHCDPGRQGDERHAA
jgi:penicillin V acylase-like amidase (Ntn superfamily)